MVLFSHSAIYHANDFINDSFMPFVMFFLINGWVGVELFFVLSGFFLASQLLSKRYSKSDIGRYFLKRFFRIAPAYYFAVFCTFLFLHAYPESKVSSFSDIFEKWDMVLLAHFLFIHDYVAKAPYIDGIFWSIPVEIKFYIFLPFLIFGLLKIECQTRRLFAILALYVFYSLTKGTYLFITYEAKDLEYLYYFFNIRSPFHMALDGFFVGVFAAVLVTHDRFKEKINPNYIFNAGFFGFICFMLFSQLVNGVVKFHEYMFLIGIFSVCFGCMLIGLVLGCDYKKFFELKLFSFLAKISYSIYLSQIFTMYFQGYVVSFAGTFISNGMYSWIASIPLMLLFSVMISLVMYRFIAKPCIIWAKRRWG